MKRNITLILLGVLSCFALLGQPTNNAISDLYSGAEGYPIWSDEFKWNNVYNMGTYSNGANNFEKFKNACLEAFNAGGGVLYYPAGTYNFDIPDGPNDEGLMLREGVVIRGVKPTTDQWAVTDLDPANLATHGLTSNTTKFVFTRKDMNADLTGVNPAGNAFVAKEWNAIGCKPANASKIGVCWIELEYGYIYFGFDAIKNDSTHGPGWNANWRADMAGYTTSFIGASKNGWEARVPNGQFIMDPFAAGGWVNTPYDAVMGEKRFIMGVHLKNSSVPNYIQQRVNNVNLANWKVEHASYRFGAKLSCYGRHLFVANNCISKPDAAAMFRFSQVSTTSPYTFTAIYDIGNGIGIDVNKSLLSSFGNRFIVNGTDGYFAQDAFIKDNWVYSHGNKGFELAGNYVVISGNVNYKQYIGIGDPYSVGGGGNLTMLIFPGGYNAHNSENSADYMSRAFDYGGWNLWFNNNRWEGSGSLGNDGESILLQRHNGVEVYSCAMTYNEQGPSGEAGYIAPYDAHAVGLFQGWNVQRGSVGLAKTDLNYYADISTVQNTTPSANPSNVAGVTGINVKDFLNLTCPSGSTPGVPAVTLTDNYSYVLIEYNNVANEAAYRIQRRLKGSGTWITIAYRPRIQTGGTVTFKIGDKSIGEIGTTANYGNGGIVNGVANSYARVWDSAVRNMNEANWRDYTKMIGTFEYRVVAVGCDDLDDGASLTSELLVSDVKYSESAPVTFIPVKVFPNPAKDIVRVEFEADAAATISLINETGKIVKVIANNTNARSIEFNASEFAAGLYFVEVATKEGATRSKLIIKE